MWQNDAWTKETPAKRKRRWEKWLAAKRCENDIYVLKSGPRREELQKLSPGTSVVTFRAFRISCQLDPQCPERHIVKTRMRRDVLVEVKVLKVQLIMVDRRQAWQLLGMVARDTPDGSPLPLDYEVKLSGRKSDNGGARLKTGQYVKVYFDPQNKVGVLTNSGKEPPFDPCFIVATGNYSGKYGELSPSLTYYIYSARSVKFI